MSHRRRRRQRASLARQTTHLEQTGRVRASRRCSGNRSVRAAAASAAAAAGRKAAETRVREMHIRNYLRHQPHAALRRRCRRSGDGSSRTPSLRSTPTSGSINMAELEVAAKALGFGPKKRARLVAGAMAGDQDQSGSLSLEEFVRLIAEGAGDAGGLGADAFPLGLMAETYRISRLVESYNPATKLQKEERRARSSAASRTRAASARAPAPRRTQGEGWRLVAGPGGAGVADRAGRAAPREPSVMHVHEHTKILSKV